MPRIIPATRTALLLSVGEHGKYRVVLTCSDADPASPGRALVPTFVVERLGADSLGFPCWTILGDTAGLAMVLGLALQRLASHKLPEQRTDEQGNTFIECGEARYSSSLAQDFATKRDASTKIRTIDLGRFSVTDGWLTP